jgi:hypothetical protein
MSPDIVCRMSMEQINTALDRLQRELARYLKTNACCRRSATAG